MHLFDEIGLKTEMSFLVAEEVTHCIFARSATGS